MDRAVVAGSSAVVVLHQSWVANSVVCGWSADTAVRFLHYDGEDEACVDASAGGDTVDGGLHRGDFVGGVVGDGELGAGGC